FGELFRWWPAQILFPHEIPENIRNLSHVRGEFAVKFFGSHDHYWVNRGRVFIYQVGESGKTTFTRVYQDLNPDLSLADQSLDHLAVLNLVFTNPDTGSKSRAKSSMDAVYDLAVVEALEAQKVLEAAKATREAEPRQG
ncbi:unnamed protein product, partial [Timema podura]|nr:unnamed protein product [Timema podura]